MPGTSIFDLSDEELDQLDISKLDSLGSSKEEEEPQGNTGEVVTSEEVTQETVVVEEQATEEPVEQLAEEVQDSTVYSGSNEVQETPKETPITTASNQPQVVEPKKAVTPSPNGGAVTEASAGPEPSVDELKEFYRTLTAPFKAGGSDIQIRNAQEAIRLMQQGVGYTQKTQEMAHQRKLYMMLEKHGLNDPSQLSYLIDLHNKNPEAIKKLVIDANLDPMEIDTTAAPAYQASNHQISDQDFMLREELENLTSLEGGYETIKVLDKWDHESQNALRRNPTDMRVFHEHMQNGTYNQIANEVTRYKSLGVIPAFTPFYQAYVTVFQEMQRLQAEQAVPTNHQQVIPGSTPQQPVQSIPPVNTPQPVAVRTAPVAPVNNANSAALAAATPRQVTPAAKKTITVDDIMSMSDAEIAKLRLP